MAHSQFHRHFGYLDTNLGQIHYWTAGAGPNLLLVHQSGNSSEEFAAMAPFLAGDFRMLAVDLPGPGRSYDPTVQPRVEDYVDAVRTVLDALDIEKTHIVGHHGGGLSAMALLAEEPDRFEKAILSGVDEDYSPEEKRALVERIENTDTRVRADADFVADAWTRYQNMLSDGAEPSLALKPFIAFLDARLRPFRGIVTNLQWDNKDALAKLRGPVLMVTGERDSYLINQEHVPSNIPDSEYLQLPGAGTFMFYDHAEQCADMVRNYLKRKS